MNPDTDWQTQTRGSLEDEYEIYAECQRKMGVEPLTFDEWLET